MNIIIMAFFISLFMTLAVLIGGLCLYFKGGPLYQKYGNAAMRWRVMLQGFTLILFMLVLYFKG